MLKLNNIWVTIGGSTILRGITLEVPAGKVVGLVGRNGAGKTITIKSILGIVPVSSGDITLDDQRLLGLPEYKRVHLGIGYMPEDRRLITMLGVEENILLPAWAAGLKNPEERLKLVYELLPELKQWAKQKAFAVSGGQGKLVALARALMVGTKLLLLDEPFEGTSGFILARERDAIQKAKELGIPVLVAESAPERLALLADTIYTIERGEIIEVQSQL